MVDRGRLADGVSAVGSLIKTRRSSRGIITTRRSVLIRVEDLGLRLNCHVVGSRVSVV